MRNSLLANGITFAALVALVGCTANTRSSKTDIQAPVLTVSDSPTPVLGNSAQQHPIPTKSPIITQAMAASVCLNMTLAEVEAILGTPGQLVNSPRTPTSGQIQSYQWKNPDGSYLWVTLVDGRVVGRGQIGLPGSAAAQRNPLTPIYEQCDRRVP